MIPSTLPRFRGPLIGRSQELRSLQALCADPQARLITVTGPGGVGKTRLAATLVATVEQEYPDGATFVDLAPVLDANLVLPALAQRLGIPRTADRPLVDLVERLRTLQMLLVLDNFEQVVEAAPDLAQLLAECPGLSALVTSRVPLDLVDERLFFLGPLSIDEVTDGNQRPDAVLLFEERSQSNGSTFARSGKDDPVVVEICRRLDGLPLAIELAAARTVTLPPRALLARLERALPLLVSGPRDAPDRQRTMRHTIEWSFDLLNAQEQELLQLLSVFVGGFSLSAAATVADRDPVEDLTALIKHNLVRLLDGDGAEPRYSMLETIREFGHAQAEETELLALACERHANWCSAFASHAQVSMDGGGFSEAWASRLDAELGNVWRALDWLAQSERWEQCLQLGVDMSYYFTARPFHVEALRWLSLSYERAPEMSTELRVAALHQLMISASLSGDFDGGIEFAEVSLSTTTPTGDLYLIGQSYYDLGLAWEWKGDINRSVAFYGEAASRLSDRDPTFYVGLVYGCWGDLLHAVGDPRAAETIERGLRAYREIDDRWGIAMVSGVRAHLALTDGDLALATRLFEESIVASREISDLRLLLGSYVGIAGLAATSGDPVDAARLLGAVEYLRAPLGISRLAHSIHNGKIQADIEQRLGPVRFAEAFTAGNTLSLDDAFELASALIRRASKPHPEHSAPLPNTWGLSPRELDVLKYVVDGRTDQQIADTLFIARRTVTSHLESIYAKLGVDNRTSAGVFAVRNGLV